VRSLGPAADRLRPDGTRTDDGLDRPRRAVIGAIAGDAGKGAAIGAAGGGMMGGMRRNDQRRQVDSQQQAGHDQWNRAYKACMEGRGYTLS
jgi:hypothetical protein